MFRHLGLAVLYMAFGLGANGAMADQVDLDALRQGDMRALVLHDTPEDRSAAAFLDPDGNEVTLADFSGRHLLVNFWATWCAPCRHEMPSLNTLQQELGGEAFEVVTIATGRNPEPAIRRFFEEESITDLPVNTDASSAMARGFGVFGLPITVLIDPEGNEVARLRGDADWASPEAIAFLRAWAGIEGDS